MNKNIIFIGSIGKYNEFGGELSKNKYILNRLKTLGYKTKKIDTYRGHKSLIKMIEICYKLLIALTFRRKWLFIFSTSFGNIYTLIKFMHIIPYQYKMIHWVIGGNFQDKVLNGDYSIKYLNDFKLHIVECNGMKDILNKKCKLNNIIVKPNFKDISYLPKINKFKDGKIHFLFISHIRKEKGVFNIINASKILNHQGFKEKYIIDFYGTIEPSIKNEFEKEISINNNINYCGKLQLENFNNYNILARYHYMLFYSYWMGEGCPGVVIDAFISGIPIIASDWQFNTEFIQNGKVGIIVSYKNEEQLIQSMKKAINGDYNNYAMSILCQNEARNYNTSNIIDEKFMQLLFN